MQDFIVSLVMMFLVEPLQADISEKLAAARAPQEIVGQLSQCASDAAPTLTERATSDPWWAVSTIVGVWIGGTDAVSVLGDSAPSCGPAIQAAKPFLGEG